MSKIIAAFDFDGTITNKDSLWEFLTFYLGRKRLLIQIAKEFPLLACAKMGLASSSQAKEQLFYNIFKGVSISEFRKLCNEFKLLAKSFLRQDAIETIQSHLSKKDTVIVITASPTEWVRPIAEELGINPNNVIGTELEISESGLLTGKFNGANCKGKEKVSRLLTIYPDRSSYTLIAYGDSKGDKELLSFADQGFYRLFIK